MHNYCTLRKQRETIESSIFINLCSSSRVPHGRSSASFASRHVITARDDLGCTANFCAESYKSHYSAQLFACGGTYLLEFAARVVDEASQTASFRRGADAGLARVAFSNEREPVVRREHRVAEKLHRFAPLLLENVQHASSRSRVPQTNSVILCSPALALFGFCLKHCSWPVSLNDDMDARDGLSGDEPPVRLS